MLRVRVSRQEKQITKQSDGCGTPGSGVTAIWTADTPYQPLARQIKFTFGRLPRASPGTAAPKTALFPAALNGLDRSFPAPLCKDDVGPCSQCQSDVRAPRKSHYMPPNGC